MSRPARCKQTKPGSIGTRFCNPVFTDPIKKSPCQQRPDTLMQCPLRKHSKENLICYNCNLLGKGPIILTVSEMKSAADEGWLRTGYESKPPKMKKPCKWPHGCKNMALTKYEFEDYLCKYHANVYRQRRRLGLPEHRWTEPVKPHRKRK